MFLSTLLLSCCVNLASIPVVDADLPRSTGQSASWNPPPPPPEPGYTYVGIIVFEGRRHWQYVNEAGDEWLVPVT